MAPNNSPIVLKCLKAAILTSICCRKVCGYRAVKPSVSNRMNRRSLATFPWDSKSSLRDQQWALNGKFGKKCCIS